MSIVGKSSNLVDLLASFVTERPVWGSKGSNKVARRDGSKVRRGRRATGPQRCWPMLMRRGNGGAAAETEKGGVATKENQGRKPKKAAAPGNIKS